MNHPASDLMARAIQVIPGGVNSNRRNLDPPFVVRRAYGAHIEDIDGRVYIDYQGGAGTSILGHADPTVLERVTTAAQQMILPAIGVTEPEVELAERLAQYIPSIEQSLLCNTGSEATLHAVRLARAVTGREKIVKFQGCYHGHHDYVLRNCQSAPEKVGKRDPHSAGMLAAAVDAALVARYNDLEDVRSVFRANEGQIAAVIIEPVAHNGPGLVPLPGFLDGLRSLCDDEGAVLIFDEVVSFRHSLGGYQAICGVMPDLTTIGKTIANGFTLAVLGGRRDLMERFNTRRGGDVYWSGAHNGNQVSVAAALATLERLADGSVHAHINGLGDMMRSGLAELTADLPVPVSVCGYGSLYSLVFAEAPMTSYDDVARNDLGLFVKYRRELISRGVFEFPDTDGFRCHISAAHTVADVEKTLDAARDSLRAVLNTTGRQ